MSQAVAIIRQIGGLVFDATFTEKHESEAEITENPVETGVTIADHMFMKPLRCTITAGVSNTPLHKSTNDPYGGGSSRAQQALTLLQQLQASFEPFSVQTGLKLYQDMVCKNITFEQDKDTSDAFIFEAELREVIFVTTQSVTIPPTAKGTVALPPVQRGTVQAVPVIQPPPNPILESIAPDDYSNSALGFFTTGGGG
jgi:hypothetical protein